MLKFQSMEYFTQLPAKETDPKLRPSNLSSFSSINKFLCSWSHSLRMSSSTKLGWEQKGGKKEESLLFYLEYQQTIFLGLFCQKKNCGKNSNFWPKPLTDLQKFEFCHFFWKEIFMLKVPSFLSRISANNISRPILPKQKLWKKIPIFDQNHGLTPLQKFEFFPLFWKEIFTLKEPFFSI